MFSDQYKYLKILVYMLVLILCGIYFNLNSPQKMPGIVNINGLQAASCMDEVCFYNVKILLKNGKYYMKNRYKEIEIKDFPVIAGQNLLGEYAIRGSINKEGNLRIEKIRRKYPRFYKLLYSGITALCVGALFFVHFRYSKKGFIPKRLGTLL